jgi:hypothetical protein
LTRFLHPSGVAQPRESEVEKGRMNCSSMPPKNFDAFAQVLEYTNDHRCGELSYTEL